MTRCRCGHPAHPAQKCPVRICGCKASRTADEGALTTLGAAVVLLLIAVALAASFLIGEHLRCARLLQAQDPQATYYCN